MNPDYLLDANIFIQASRMNYSFDIFPGFWEWLDNEQNKGVLSSIIPIGQELKNGNDFLSEWAGERMASKWFLSVEEEITQNEYRKVASWASSTDQEFKQHVVEDFLSVADSWLIAKASAQKCTIVTHETYEPNRKSKIKIPNVCSAFSISCIGITELFRKTRAIFILNQ